MSSKLSELAPAKHAPNRSRECCVKYNNAKRDGTVPADTCPECGPPVEQTGERGRYRRFCSDRCRMVYHKKKRQEQKRSIEKPKQMCPNAASSFSLVGAAEQDGL